MKRINKRRRNRLVILMSLLVWNCSGCGNTNKPELDNWFLLSALLGLSASASPVLYVKGNLLEIWE